MISLSSKAILISSLAVAAAAAMGVANLYFGGQAQSSGVDPAQVRQAALRLEQARLSAPGGSSPLDVTAAAHYTTSPFMANLDSAPADAPEPVVVLTAAPAARREERATAASAPPESPVKDLALMGVTRQSGDEHAWLVDVNNNQRVTVGEGGTAWGFTVRDIEPESVVLTRGDEQWTLRLGEREIPGAQTTLASEAGGAPGEDGSRFGRGRGEGGDDAERDQRREMFRRMMEGRGGSGGPGGFDMSGFRGSFSPSSSSFGRPSFGGSSGSSWRGGSSSEGSRPRMEFSSSSSPWRGGSSSSSSGSSWRGGSSSSGRSSGGSSSRFSSNSRSTSATSNPQTQRRQQAAGGGAGGAQPIVNPQTQRRTGGSAGSRSTNSRSSGSRLGGSNFGGSDRGTSTFSSSR